jgi:hypothetical protein
VREVEPSAGVKMDFLRVEPSPKALEDITVEVEDRYKSDIPGRTCTWMTF